MESATIVKVTLRQEKLRSGKVSLYLDYYPPIWNPHIKKMSRREFLGLYLYGDPKDRFERDYNEEIMLKARGIRAKRELAIINEEYGFLDRTKKQADFLGYFHDECSVSVPVFTFLADKYGDDVAVVWIDAHPDITLPGDDYTGYHAMALTAIMGKGASEIVGQLPAKVSPDKICLAGLRECEYPYIEKRVEELGLSHYSPSELATDSSPVIDWLRQSCASKVMIHFDMDVMDPADILAAVADGSEGGLKLKEVVRLINDIAREKELVALTVAEPMPRLAIRLKQMLSGLPLL